MPDATTAPVDTGPILTPAAAGIGRPVPLATAMIAAVPAAWDGRIRLAALRALRTLMQGLAGAFPAAGAGVQIVGASYWTSFGFAALAAVIAALVAFLQNVASFLPDDPTQR